MKPRSKLQTNYFSYALYSVIFTALLFVIFGYNGWGPAAQNEQAIGEISRWCERVSSGFFSCLLYTSPSPRDATLSRMPSSA